MDREQINKIYSDYLNDCESEHDMEQIFDLALQAQADEDAISRSAAIKAIDERAKRIKNEDTLNGLAGAVGVLFDLPPVKPQEPINLIQVNLDCRYSYFDADDKHEILYCRKDDCECDLKVIPSADKWIPVSERLPDDGTYLVTVERMDGEPSIDMRSFAKDLNKVNEFDFPKHKCGWYDYDSEYGYWEEIKVIAWMPLPEPYKAESEDGK